MVEREILWHHGSCDCCKVRNVLVCHFGYNQQLKASYRICTNCLYDNIQVILFGRDDYADGLLREEKK